MSEHSYDAVVLGAGPAGEVCAGRLADAGWKVALVERDLVGGECSYYACMPSKALLRPADLIREAARVPGVPVDDSSELDPAAILARRDEVIHGRDDAAQLPWLEERGIDLHRGAARIEDERRVSVGGDVLVAERALVLATGSRAAMPPIDGLGEVRAWNNRDATTAEQVPESMIVLGGGPVGCELSQAWASLGATVTLIEGERLLSREEPFAGEEVGGSLGENFGVDVRTGSMVERVRAGGSGVIAELKDGGTVEAAEILIAVGRTPNSDGLGLDGAGIEPDEHGFVACDARMRVGGSDRLYAIGDVNGRALFTHTGKYQAWVATESLLGRPVEAVSEPLGPPRVTFTDPQVAAVGKTLEQAREAGIEARAVDVPTDGTPGASFYGKGTGGTSRIVVDEAAGTIVGATFTGFETADFLQAATVAIVGEVPLTRLRHAVAPFPSRSEIWLKLVEKYESGD